MLKRGFRLDRVVSPSVSQRGKEKLHRATSSRHLGQDSPSHRGRRGERSIELEPEMISKKLMPITFGAIHTTAFTIMNCLLDLLAAGPCGRDNKVLMDRI